MLDVVDVGGGSQTAWPTTTPITRAITAAPMAPPTVRDRRGPDGSGAGAGPPQAAHPDPPGGLAKP
ncbi:MAG: hypothetical protein M0Z93_09680 [Actinomycetota bacterium]|nr:hypothetical protein [Actinomycetota bacterium]